MPANGLFAGVSLTPLAPFSRPVFTPASLLPPSLAFAIPFGEPGLWDGAGGFAPPSADAAPAVLPPFLSGPGGFAWASSAFLSAAAAVAARLSALPPRCAAQEVYFESG